MHPSLTITKYHFSGLLNQAWVRTMTLSTICAGFRKCGVYPFNPNAIDCSISVANVDGSDKENDDDNNNQKSGEVPEDVGEENTESEAQQSRVANERVICEQWPAEKLALFQRRYEEGYNIPDEEYMQWLDKTHPNAGNDIGNNSLSLMDYFSDAPIATPVTVSSQLSTEVPVEVDNGGPLPDNIMASEEEKDREVSSHTLLNGDTLVETECAISSSEKSVDVPLQEVNDMQPEIALEHGKLLPYKRTSVEIAKDRSYPDANNKDIKNQGDLRYISKYLVQFVPNAKPQSKHQMVRISGARVLTGDTCAAILQEREEKKQKEKAEKEKRKLLREQKKKEKEEELRKKKAAAAEKKAALAEKKAALAQKKATAAVKRAVGKAAAARKRLSADNNIVPTESEENQVTRKRQTSSYTLRDKRIRFDGVLDSDTPSSSAPVNTDDTGVKDHSGAVWQCSICFENYGEEDDEVWVQCGCGRWTHEVCISQSDIIVDANGKELFCPYCSV